MSYGLCFTSFSHGSVILISIWLFIVFMLKLFPISCSLLFILTIFWELYWLLLVSFLVVFLEVSSWRISGTYGTLAVPGGKGSWICFLLDDSNLQSTNILIIPTARSKYAE